MIASPSPWWVSPDPQGPYYVPHYCSLVSANPCSQPNPRDLLEEMRRHGGYLAGPLISLAVGVEELHVSIAISF